MRHIVLLVPDWRGKTDHPMVTWLCGKLSFWGKLKIDVRNRRNMEEVALQEIKRDIEEIKIQLAFLLSRYMEEEDLSNDEKMEIEKILRDVGRGEYITKEALKRELLGE